MRDWIIPAVCAAFVLSIISCEIGRESVYRAAVDAEAGKWVADPKTGAKSFQWASQGQQKENP